MNTSKDTQLTDQVYYVLDGGAVVVFDGYIYEMSTKATTHIMRNGISAGVFVDFNSTIVMHCKKEAFLNNKCNKQAFIILLGEKAGCTVKHLQKDVDVLIVHTVLDSANVPIQYW